MIKIKVFEVIAWETAEYRFSIVAVHGAFVGVIACGDGDDVIIAGVSVLLNVFIAISCGIPPKWNVAEIVVSPADSRHF